MMMTPIDITITSPGLARIPVVDQAMELAKLMGPVCTPNDVAHLLKSAANTWEMATTMVVKPVDSP